MILEVNIIHSIGMLQIIKQLFINVMLEKTTLRAIQRGAESNNVNALNMSEGGFRVNGEFGMLKEDVDFFFI